MQLNVSPSTKLRGNIRIPASKSHSLRAAIFALLAEGESRIHSPLRSPDADACLSACQQLGAQVTLSSDTWTIKGTGGNFKNPERTIDVGNSGITLRFIAGIAAACQGPVTIDGDDSARGRPMDDVCKMLEDLGAKPQSSDGRAPLTITGPIVGGSAEFQGRDSQPVSAALLASLLCPEPVSLHVLNPGEKPWIDFTLWWFDKFGLRYQTKNYECYELPGKQALKSFELTVPADFSSAAFPLLSGLIIPGSATRLQGLDIDDPQGDKGVIEVLQSMGGHIEVGNDIAVHSSALRGRQIDVNPFIDAVPILAVAGCYASGTTELVNAGIARTKECDRLAVMSQELRKMGAKIREEKDRLIIEQSQLRGCELEAHHDHRVALALSVAALGAEGPSSIRGADCIATTDGEFPEDMAALGAQIRRSP